MAGGDHDYLRHEQYRDAQRLIQRASLHVKYRGDAAELARVVHPDSAVIGSTNRRHHLRPLGRILAEVLGVPELSDTLMAFLAAAVEARFAAGGGVLSITADPGCFVCRR